MISLVGLIVMHGLFSCTKMNIVSFAACIFRGENVWVEDRLGRKRKKSEKRKEKERKSFSSVLITEASQLI